MNTFIGETVAKLYKLYGEDISTLNLILPSSRARLFFNSELAKLINERPIWQPEFYSIDSLTEKLSGLKSAERFRLITELYRVYSKYHKESFDKFYLWGEVLLGDFDSVDKYMIDAKKLFVNANDLKKIENAFDFLTEEQAEVVGRFWSVFKYNTKDSYHKNRFLELWNTLYVIYSEFRENLIKDGVGYSGLIYRKAVEKVESGDVDGGLIGKESIFAAIGFNALTICEQKIFRYLSDNFKTHFFWDYDNYFLLDSRQEAGHFIRENIKLFPESNNDISRDNFIDKKEISIINAPSKITENKCIWDILERLQSESITGKLGKETAIVLTDESMLIPTLYSIPNSVEHFNITSGYDISLSAAYTLFENLISLQRNVKQDKFYYRDVINILNHPHICCGYSLNEGIAVEIFIGRVIENSQLYIGTDQLCVLFEDAEKCFKIVGGYNSLSAYLIELFTLAIEGNSERQNREFLSAIKETITTTTISVENSKIELSNSIFISLLRKHICQRRISFSGEPLLGVQVMGILESRNLDFENVIILSLDDNNFPGKKVGKSFIPYALRSGYGLPTPYHTEAMYSYYFYRLISRAKRVFLTYCSKSLDTSLSEPSRYISQLRIESPHRASIEERVLSLSINITQKDENDQVKDDDVMRVLNLYLSGKRRLSASALYKYLECPYQFYLRYIEDLKSPLEVHEELDASTFGNVVHNSLEEIYSRLLNAVEPILLLKKIEVREIKDIAVRHLSLLIKVPSDQFSSSHILKLAHITKYIKNVIDYDIANPNFKLRDVERSFSGSIRFPYLGGEASVLFNGRVDRVDELTERSRKVIDYKTSGKKNSVKSIEDIFSADIADRNIAIMQSLLYCSILEELDGYEYTPAVYSVPNMVDVDYDYKLKIDGSAVDSFSMVKDSFNDKLKSLLSEIFSPELTFKRSPQPKRCSYCDYKSICGY